MSVILDRWNGLETLGFHGFFRLGSLDSHLNSPDCSSRLVGLRASSRPRTGCKPPNDPLICRRPCPNPQLVHFGHASPQARFVSFAMPWTKQPVLRAVRG